MISCFFFALFLSTSQECEKRISSQNKDVSFSSHEFAPGMHASMLPSFGLASERREGPLCQGSETAHRETGGSRRRSRTSRLPVNSTSPGQGCVPGLCFPGSSSPSRMRCSELQSTHPHCTNTIVADIPPFTLGNAFRVVRRQNHDKYSLNILTGFLWESRPKQHPIL